MNPSHSAILRRKFRRLISSKMISLPMAFGTLATSVAVAGGSPTNALGIAGMIGITLGLGAAVKRWITDGEQLTELARQDVLRTSTRDHERYLRGLRDALRRDRDPRTSQMVKKMQKLHRRLKSSTQLRKHDSTGVFAELHQDAQQLYESCLSLLERSLQQWRIANDMATPEAREGLMKAREQLVTEVQQSIDHLDRTLDHLQTAQVRRRAEARDEAARLREELDEGLAVARQVEQRIEGLETDLRFRERS